MNQPQYYPQPGGAQHYPQPGGAPYYAPPPPPSAAPKRTGPLVLGLVGGLVIALIAGAVLYFTDVLSFGEKAVDTTPIALPSSVNGLRPINEVSAELAGSAQADRNAEYTSLAEAKLTEELSASYGGAAATVRFYSDKDLLFRPTLLAVRASTPGLFWPEYTGPEALERLQLAELPREIVTVGEVECEVIRLQTTPAGQTIDPANTRATVCQRTSAELTVRAYGGTSGDGNSLDINVALVNSLWDTLGGSTQ